MLKFIYLRIDRNFCLVHEEITSIRLYTPCKGVYNLIEVISNELYVFWCVWFKNLRLFSNVRNLKIDVVLKVSRAVVIRRFSLNEAPLGLFKFNFIDWLFNCCFDTTLCGTVCQWHTACRWFSQGTPVFTTNKTDCHDIISYLRSYP
jgi:hypothetical protein